MSMCFTLQEEGVDVAELERRLAEEEAEEDARLEAEAQTPEDYWTPLQPPIVESLVDTYGPISPIPEHDGTECLKWDNSLWSHADHFKVGEPPSRQHFFLFCTSWACCL
jgi:1,4-alpha-glucan branching enzyme